MTNKQIESILKSYDERLETLCYLYTNNLVYTNYYDFNKAVIDSLNTVQNLIFGLYYYDMINSELFEELMNETRENANSCL